MGRRDALILVDSFALKSRGFYFAIANKVHQVHGVRPDPNAGSASSGGLGGLWGLCKGQAAGNPLKRRAYYLACRDLGKATGDRKNEAPQVPGVHPHASESADFKTVSATPPVFWIVDGA